MRDGRFYIFLSDKKRKNIYSIESKKRSLYKKRYIMMDNLSYIIVIKLKFMCDVTKRGGR
ncbi:DUF535 family protein [Sulfurimonas sp.]|uniref:DUF535 family protein n=1 Tax=Sulfurimonas sp. TaxID=2022749 RepID=UPI00345D363C